MEQGRQARVSEEAWVVATVSALRATSSWGGRLHLHKHLFIAQTLGLVEPPFEFELYRYGPYSFELDRCVAEMEAFGLLNKEFPQPGYGARYSVSSIGAPIQSELSGAECRKIQRVAHAIGEMSSKELELAATCLWVMRRDGERDKEAVVKSVRRIKPRYSDTEVESAFAQANELEAKLANSRAEP